MPALQTPTLSHQTQQCLCGGSQAGVEPVFGFEQLAVTGAFCNHVRNPAGAMPVLLDVVWRLLGPEIPGVVTPMADLMIRCYERDFALSSQVAGDLAVESLLVGFNRQEEAGSLLLVLSKNAC
jgi:hypothetical protein